MGLKQAKGAEVGVTLPCVCVVLKKKKSQSHASVPLLFYTQVQILTQPLILLGNLEPGDNHIHHPDIPGERTG